MATNAVTLIFSARKLQQRPQKRTEKYSYLQICHAYTDSLARGQILQNTGFLVFFGQRKVRVVL